MDVLFATEDWLVRVESDCQQAGHLVRILRSPSDRLDRSISMNFAAANGDELVDLTIWESGQAELLLPHPAQGFETLHFEGLGSACELSSLLAIVRSKLDLR
jgi:hypothetical protein